MLLHICQKHLTAASETNSSTCRPLFTLYTTITVSKDDVATSLGYGRVKCAIK